VRLVRELARTEKACTGLRARAAARVAALEAHHRDGARDAAEWLAKATGTTAGEAKAAMETATALENCPATKAALAAGELSLKQASEIAKAEADCPGSEADLLALARGSSFGALRDEARRRRAKAADPAERHRRQRQARELRHWIDELGMVCGRFALPPDVGLPIVNRLEAECDRIRRTVRRDGTEEPRAAHLADALLALLSGVGRGRARRADVVFVCDLRAWRRGHAQPGEPCHIIGGGPVPVDVIGEHIGDAFVKAVTHDGVRIDTVVHYGRHLTAELRTALDLGDPPDFDGAVCDEPGCGRRDHLEWDHVNPVANRGPTCRANLRPRCWPHHQEKTERDRQAGLLGGRGDGRGPP